MDATILSKNGSFRIFDIKESEIDLLNKLVEIGAINYGETEFNFFLPN